MIENKIKKILYKSKLINLLRDDIINDNVKILSDTIIVFVCGGNLKETNKYSRKTLIEYANKHFKKNIFFVAEKIFELYNKEEENDLLRIENYLCEYSDCIIIILESIGAFTELGAFSNKDELVNKLLIINDIEYKTIESFVNLGPLARIEKVSKFKPVIYIKLKSILIAISDIEMRLKEKGVLKENKRTIKVSKIETKTTKHNQKEMKNNKIKLYLLYEIIKMFYPIHERELKSIVRYLFSKWYIKPVELSLIETLEFAKRDNEDSYYYPNINIKEKYLNFKNINYIDIRSEIIRYYFQNDYNKIEALNKEFKK